MPKLKNSGTSTGNAVRHAPLGKVIENDEFRSKYASNRSYGRVKSLKKKIDCDTTLLGEKETKRILELGKIQMQEIELEGHDVLQRRKRHTTHKMEESDESIDEFEHGFSAADEAQEDDEESLVKHDAGFVTVIEGTSGLTPEEEVVVAAMMDSDRSERRTLADIIFQKIKEKESQQQQNMMEEIESSERDDGFTDIPPKVAQVYTDIGKILSRYTAGKLPKAFKVIPSLNNWEEIIYLTRPDQWTPQAMFAATRIFASNLNPKMAQRFYNLVLLDAIRADIVENQKLNYHYYRCLKKSIYKPAAFFKGILLPLCKSNCSLREAAIVASVLQKMSIPVHHSAVAIHKLAAMEYSGAASIFIKTLLNKKYSLPAPVIGSVIQHFVSFLSNDSKVLPVLWHQALLVFVQRYKGELQTEAKESLKLVMRKHSHHKITVEIRRELFGAQAWKDERVSTTQLAAMET